MDVVDISAKKKMEVEASIGELDSLRGIIFLQRAVLGGPLFFVPWIVFIPLEDLIRLS